MTNEKKEEGWKTKMYKKEKKRGTKGTLGQNTPNSTQHTLKVPRAGGWWPGMHFLNMWWGKKWKMGPWWACFSRVPELQFWPGLMHVDEKVSGLGVVFDKEDKNKEVLSIAWETEAWHPWRKCASTSSLQKGQKPGMNLIWTTQWTCSLLHEVFFQFVSMVDHTFSSEGKLGP